MYPGCLREWSVRAILHSLRSGRECAGSCRVGQRSAGATVSLVPGIFAGSAFEIGRARQGRVRGRVVGYALRIGVLVGDRLSRGGGAGGCIAGVAIIVPLPLVCLTLSICARLPLVGVVDVDVREIDAATISVAVTVPAIFPIMVPSAPVSLINATAVPIKVIGQPGTHSETQAECERWNSGVGFDVNDLRVVDGNINHFRVCRNNPDNLLLLDDFLLGRIDKMACGPGLFAQPLDGVHHIRRLLDKRLSH